MLRKNSGVVVRTRSGDAPDIKDRVFIGTLGIDCVEYSKRTIDSVCCSAKEVFFCYMDNGSTEQSLEVIKAWKVTNPDIGEFEIVENRSNVGVAVGWNKLIKRAIEWDANKIVICNNDIVFGKYTLDGMCTAYDKLREGDSNTVMVTAANRTKNPDQLPYIRQEWNYHQHPDFSCFLITAEIVECIGWFNEKYTPAFFEDNDYHHRILLMGYKAWGTDWAPYSHIASRTRYSHPDIVPHQQFRNNRQLFYDTFHVDSPDQEIEDKRYAVYMEAHQGHDPHPDWEDVLRWCKDHGEL